MKSIKNKLTYLACLSVLVFSFVFYLYSVSGSVFLAKAASGITYGSESNQTILNGDDESRMNFSYKEIIVSDGSSTFILMDRNLGAKAAWDGTTWEDASANYDSDSDYYGYYYQWGNNYGFSAKTKNAGAGKVFTNSVPSNYLSSRWISNSPAWNTNNDLWGDITNSEPARHGPCPVGWHVPTQNEWNLVYNTWKNADGKSTDESSEVKNFAKDLKLPPAGSRFYGSLLFNNRGSNGYYWSSFHGNSNQSAANLFFYDSPSSSYFNFNQKSERSNGLPVRCFKNTSEIKTYTVTFDTRGGITKIESQKVKELDKAIEPSEIPLKFGTQFVAWTTADKKEFDFSFPIVQDITLYAKWEGESDSPYYDYDEDNYLLTADGIVVTGVANTIEYLTSLYLYVTDPYASTSVELKYDSELNALLINSPINANAMGIGFNNFGEGVVGSVSIGGSGNIFNIRGQEIFDDYGDYTGRRNGRNDSAVAIGGESNRPGPAGGVAIGGKNSGVHFPNSAVVGGVDSSVGGHHSVFLGSNKSSLNVQDWNSIDMGYNNHGDKSTYLLGSGIDTHPRGYSWSSAANSLFAWSPGEEGFPLLGGGLGGQQGFYINAKNGFGLNTSTPRLTFDFRSGGPLKVIAAKGIENNSLNFGGGNSDGIICWDQGETRFYRGTLAYVQRGGIGAFCGCNGSYWMPLSSDAVEQSLCVETKADARVCDGEEILHNVVLHTGTRGAARWDEDANDGKGAWINLNWTFMGVPSLLSGDIRECSYTCAVGYHPNNKSAKGWFTGDCVPCDELKNGQYVTPGTGVNDCEFRCNGGYKYDKWAEKKDDRCTPCKAGEWTPNLNQFSKCNICKLPNGVSAKSETLRAGIIFTGGVLWNGTTGTGEPYFRKFTSFASTEDGCKFECASGFYLGSGGTTCVECGIGTFSPGGIYGGCAQCENMEAKDISFSVREPGGNSYSYTIAAKDVSWYTTKGRNGSESCEWICNPEIGFVKDGKSCKCPTGSHLELVNGKPRCVSNIGDLACTGVVLGPLAIKGSTIATGVSAGTLSNNHWEARNITWKYAGDNKNSKDLKACEWTCPEDYKQDGNNCKLPQLGICGSANGKLVDSLNDSNLCETKLGHDFKSLSEEIEIKYFDSKNIFQFYPSSSNSYRANPAKYLAIWTCKGYNGNSKYSASCFAYVKGDSKKAQCPSKSEWRDSNGLAVAKCIYDTPTNCKEGVNCPPVVNVRSSNVVNDNKLIKNNTLPNGKTWTCPGTFGEGVVFCHACDSGYSWWNAYLGCTKDVIETDCFGNPSRSNANFGPRTYTNTFSESADNYKPGVKYYTRLADGTPASSLGACEYACEDGAHTCGDDCILNPICGSLNFDVSGNVVDDDLCDRGSSSRVTTGSDGNFEWSCRKGCQTRDCGANAFSCSSYGIPEHSVNVGQRYGLTTPPPSNALYENESDAINVPCSYVCAEGYTFLYATGSLPNRCEKCDVGTLNEDKTYCLITVDCSSYGSGYVSDGNGGCIKMGNCEVLLEYNNTLPEHAIGNINDMLPINGNGSWTCKDDPSKVTPHSCEYSCEDGYFCYGYHSCSKPTCEYFWSSSYGDSKYAVKYENPTADLAKQNGRASIGWQFLNATSLEDFNNQVYDENGNNKKEGCFYRCTEDIDRGGTYPKCFKANAEANAYTCIGSLDGTRDENIITTEEGVILEDANKNWEFVASKEEYDRRVSEGEQCLYRCKDGFTRQKFSWGELCTQTCAADQFMNTYGVCRACYKEDEIPDPDSIQNGNATKCKSMCDPETENWSTEYKECILKNLNMLECPKGYEKLGTDPNTGALICGKKFE